MIKIITQIIIIIIRITTIIPLPNAPGFINILRRIYI
jgi:hypothetical protein